MHDDARHYLDKEASSPLRNDYDRNVARGNAEILAGKTFLESRPVKLSVSLTRDCNLDCIMCPDERIVWDIPGHTVKEIKGLFPYLKNVQWQGGEVFFSKYFDELFSEAARHRNLRQNIVTNGLLLDEAWIEKIIRANAILELSIDGLTRETYERIRKGGRFDTLEEKLELVRDCRKKYPKSAFVLKMHFVVMKSNAHEVANIVDFAERYGINELLLDKVIDFHNDALFAREDVEKFPETLRYVRELMPGLSRRAQGAGITLYHYFPGEGSGKEEGKRQEDDPGSKERLPVFCGVPWRRLSIASGGEVKPGCACRAGVGNVADDTLERIWNNDGMQTYRRKLLCQQQEGFCSPLCLSDRADRENDRCP